MTQDQKPEEIDLGKAEQQAILLLHPELQEHSALNKFAYDLLQELLVQVPETRVRDMPQSLKVAIGLLARLVNDLRCAALLAHRGYAVQACTIVASMYEVAYTIAYVGSDGALAQQWIDHDDPTRWVWSAWVITREGLRKLGVPNLQEQTPVEFRVYSQLCMAKHANPLFQMQHSYRAKDDKVAPILGPDDLEAVRAAQFAMEHASALAFIAGASFVREHLSTRISDDALAELNTKLETLGRERKLLEAKAKARWGTSDPFPGKWRGMTSGEEGKP